MSISDFFRSNPSDHHVGGHIPLDDALGHVEHGPSHRGMFGPEPAQLYDPDPGRPEFFEIDYQPYSWEMPLHPTPLLHAPLPDEFLPPEPPNYDACLMTNELFDQAMRDALSDPTSELGAEEALRGPQAPFDSKEEIIPSDPIQEIEWAIDRAQQAIPPYSMEPDLPGPEMLQDPGFMNLF